MASWKQKADQAIATVVYGLPKDADVETMKRALRASYPFGERESWPYTVWLREVNRYLAVRFPEESAKQARRAEARLEERRIKRGGLSPLPESLQLNLFGKTIK